eukprot:Gb_37564 [translate_table: standard]
MNAREIAVVTGLKGGNRINSYRVLVTASPKDKNMAEGRQRVLQGWVPISIVLIGLEESAPTDMGLDNLTAIDAGFDEATTALTFNLFLGDVTEVHWTLRRDAIKMTSDIPF